MAEKPAEYPLDVISDEKDDGEENEKRDESGMSLERKDSFKARTLRRRGHLRVKEDGKTTYKRTSSQAIMAAIQLGIGYSVGRLSAKQERDILISDFNFVEKVWFPGSGSRETPSHRFVDFKFKSYAPSAFRYFRELFRMLPSDFLISLSNEELREVSNPGASGSMFFLSADDNFIVKTVQHKEATFLQQLLPGYYMNLHQNPRTLLPKFFGLYCYQSQNRNIRLAVMNNILPTTFRCHQIYDLKGSTFKRKASKKELTKKTPTKKDLDFKNDYPERILLDKETYDAVVKTIKRDCRVLESFKIMDYSLLLGIHNVDQALREKNVDSSANDTSEQENPERIARRHEFGAALEAIQIDKVDEVEGRPLGGIPAKSAKGDRLILFLGIIDILQSYRLVKKLEHSWKSIVHDGDTVSVHNPSFYADRFVKFLVTEVFKVAGLGKSSTKKRSMRSQPGASASLGPRHGGSLTESLTPRGKDGKPKSTSVKFSEPTYIDPDLPRDEEIIPPPYQAEASSSDVKADLATGGVAEIEGKKVVSVEYEGSNNVVSKIESLEPEVEIVAPDARGAESCAPEADMVVPEVEHHGSGFEVTAVKADESEQPVQSIVPEAEHPASPIRLATPLDAVDPDAVVVVEKGDKDKQGHITSVEVIETSIGKDNVIETWETTYDVTEEDVNNDVITSTTTTVVKTVGNVVVTTNGANEWEGEEEMERAKTTGEEMESCDQDQHHVMEDKEEVLKILAVNSQPAIKLNDVTVHVNSNKNETMEHEITTTTTTSDVAMIEEVTTL